MEDENEKYAVVENSLGGTEVTAWEGCELKGRILFSGTWDKCQDFLVGYKSA